MIYLITQQESLFPYENITLITLSEAIQKLKQYTLLGLDTETGGLDRFTKPLLLLQLGTFEEQFLFDIISYNNLIPDELKVFLNEFLGTFILQNAKFDLGFLFKQGVILKKVYDTMLAEIILTNGLQYSGRDLATISYKYCQISLNKEIRGLIIHLGLTQEVLEYGANDVKYLIPIKQTQEILLQEKNLLRALELDNAFVIVLAYVEFCGIKLDYEKWVEKTSKNQEKVLILKDELEQQLFEDKKYEWFSGMQDMFTLKFDCLLNWDSPKQVTKLLKSYGVNTTIKQFGETKESIDAKVLEPQQEKFPILKKYLAFKELQKEISTYGESWKRYINPVTHRIHTTYQQLMDTGRLSSGNKHDGTPNMQNIPSDHETRSCFIAEAGNIMIDADYQGQETIVLANLSKEPNLLKFYEKGLKDMHSYIAFLMYPQIRICNLDEISEEALVSIKKNHKDKRQIAKSAGFAIAYGGDGATISKNCNISKSDGIFVYNSYFAAFPEMKQYFNYVFQLADHYGYIQFNNITQRKYFFDLEKNDYFSLKKSLKDPLFAYNTPEIHELERAAGKAKNEIQRKAQNFCIQGTSSDITKYAAILFFKEILKHQWFNVVKIVNLVHDEILVECPQNMEEEVKNLLILSMEEAGKPFCKIVPLKADAVSGTYWIH